VTTENWNCVITVIVINWTMFRGPNTITLQLYTLERKKLIL